MLCDVEHLVCTFSSQYIPVHFLSAWFILKFNRAPWPGAYLNWPGGRRLKSVSLAAWSLTIMIIHGGMDRDLIPVGVSVSSFGKKETSE
jgi:hypothetical protein